MHHDTPLIATIVAGIVLAFIFGAIANRLRFSPLVGYLVAGVADRPVHAGLRRRPVARAGARRDRRDPADVRRRPAFFAEGPAVRPRHRHSRRHRADRRRDAARLGACPLDGWSAGGGLVFGLALSVASTVVLLRALQERRLVQTDRGRIAVGWLIVEDLAMVLALVLLPPLGALLSVATDERRRRGFGVPGPRPAAGARRSRSRRSTAFVVLMLVVGRRVIPWILHYTAHTGSRELFRLGVLAIGLGVAYGAAQLFDVSFALGAFFAGMVLAESELSHRAAEESLPLRDAFAVLFFVSVGMLFDPAILSTAPARSSRRSLIIMIGKSVAAFAIVRAFGHPAATVGADRREPRADRRVLLHPRGARRRARACCRRRAAT